MSKAALELSFFFGQYALNVCPRPRPPFAPFYISFFLFLFLSSLHKGTKLSAPLTVLHCAPHFCFTPQLSTLTFSLLNLWISSKNESGKAVLVHLKDLLEAELVPIPKKLSQGPSPHVPSFLFFIVFLCLFDLVIPHGSSHRSGLQNPSRQRWGIKRSPPCSQTLWLSRTKTNSYAT